MRYLDDFYDDCEFINYKKKYVYAYCNFEESSVENGNSRPKSLNSNNPNLSENDELN